MHKFDMNGVNKGRLKMNKLNIDEKNEVLTLYIKIPLFNKHIALFWIDKRINKIHTVSSKNCMELEEHRIQSKKTCILNLDSIAY